MILKKKKMKKKKQAKKINYSDIEEIVEYLVRTKAYDNRFDCYDTEDIAQEIRIICLRAIEHFDISRVKDDKLVNFFGRCVDNGLKNLKRDNYIRYTPPCNSDCDYLHGDQYTKDEVSKVCKRWLRFKKNIDRKISIKHPISVDSVAEGIRAPNFEEEVEAEDLKRFLISSISDELRPYLKTVIYGDKRDVPLKLRYQLQEEVRNILGD